MKKNQALHVCTFFLHIALAGAIGSAKSNQTVTELTEVSAHGPDLRIIEGMSWIFSNTQEATITYILNAVKKLLIEGSGKRVLVSIATKLMDSEGLFLDSDQVDSFSTVEARKL